MVKILLADDHNKIYRGLKMILQNHVGHSLIEEACDGRSVFEKVKHNDYELIVLDVNMSIADSESLVTDIVSLKPDARILLFGVNGEGTSAKRFLQLGAMGYLTKESDGLEIIRAIDNVLDNKRYLSPATIENLAQDEFKEKNGNPFSRLSRREFQILIHLLKKKSVTEISEVLHLQPSAVGTFKERIFEKLNCRSIIELFSLASMYKIQYN